MALNLNESNRKAVGRSNIERASSTVAAPTAIVASNAAVPAATKTSRGRPRRKALVAMYQSQLSENTMGIKIRLKKSIEAPISTALRNNNNSGYTNVAVAATSVVTSAAAAATTIVPKTTKQKKLASNAIVPLGSPVAASSTTPSTSKPTRKRQRKSRHKDTSDSDDSDYEKRRKSNNTAMEKYRNRKHTTNTASDYTEPDEQSQWGNVIPEHILLKIFEEAINQYGSLPLVVNVGRVCSLWRRVSLTPHLWSTMDLSTWTKDRSEVNLKRIIATHLRWCKDVNLGKT